MKKARDSRLPLCLVVLSAFLFAPAALGQVTSILDLASRPYLDPDVTKVPHAFHIMLDREPTQAAIDNWLQLFAAGYTTDDLVLQVFNSSEFQNGNGIPGLSDEELIELLYEIFWKIHFQSLPESEQQEAQTALLNLLAQPDLDRDDLVLYFLNQEKGVAANPEFHCASLQDGTPESHFIPFCTELTVDPTVVFDSLRYVKPDPAVVGALPGATPNVFPGEADRSSSSRIDMRSNSSSTKAIASSTSRDSPTSRAWAPGSTSSPGTTPTSSSRRTIRRSSPNLRTHSCIPPKSISVAVG
jgi:hypothetical protein